MTTSPLRVLANAAKATKTFIESNYPAHGKLHLTTNTFSNKLGYSFEVPGVNAEVFVPMK